MTSADHAIPLRFRLAISFSLYCFLCSHDLNNVWVCRMRINAFFFCSSHVSVVVTTDLQTKVKATARTIALVLSSEF